MWRLLHLQAQALAQFAQVQRSFTFPEFVRFGFVLLPVPSCKQLAMALSRRSSLAPGALWSVDCIHQRFRGQRHLH